MIELRKMVNRKVAIIVAWLVPEAREKGNEEIAKKIREELATTHVPYAEKIERVTVLNEGEMYIYTGCKRYSTRLYILTQEIYSRLARKGDSLVCERCSKELNVGDKVVSRVSGGRVKRYHKDCWNGMYFKD